MNHTTLFIAPLGARNKRDNVFREILSLCQGNNFSDVLYLAPNNFILSTAKRQFFSFYKKERNKAVYIPFQAFTLKQLAAQLYETNPPCPPFSKGGRGGIISERMRTLLLSEILKDQNIGYAFLLSDLFRKIRHYVPDKDLSQLKDEVGQLIFEEKTKERAIKAIETLQAYESFLKERNLIDTEDMLRRYAQSTEHRAKNKEQRTKNKEQRTKNKEQRTKNKENPPVPPFTKGGGFIPKLLTPNSKLYGTIIVDGFFDPTPLELRMMNALVESTDSAIILAEENTELLRYFLPRKEEMNVKKLDRAVHRETTGYFSYNSIEEEVEGIAKNIGKLIIEGVKPWEITVCFPSLSQYLPMLRRVFGKYGIHTSIGEYSLSASKPVALLEEIITCVENDYSRNDFLSILTSPCLTLIDDAVKKRAVTLSYKAGIIKGKESWLSIEAVIKSINGDLSENDKKGIAEFQKAVRQVIDVLESIKPPLDRGELSPPLKRGDAGGFIDAFESALDKLGYFDYLKNGEISNQISSAIKNIFTELRQVAELHGTNLQAGDAGFYLRHLLSDLTVSDENIDGVKILPYELAAAIESRALFFGGMIEGSFPSRPGIDPVFPEKVKKALGIPDLEYYLKRQSEYFRRLLNASALEPYISCPAAEGDKVFLPSPFLDWEKMIIPAELNIFTEEDVLVAEGAASSLNSKSGAETYFDAKALGILRARIGAMAKRYFRVTDIDYYRKCPFRYYLEKILGLEMETPPRFEVEYRQWGNLAHRTMEYLFKDKDWELEDFEKRLFKALEKSLKDIPINEFWADVTREIFRNLLPMLRKQETEIRAKGFNPYLTEEKIEAEIDGIKLRGKIDRVDTKKGQGALRQVQDDTGQRVQSDNVMVSLSNHETQTPVSVILLDYKTGSIDNKSLQLPLYARMWQGKHSEQVEEVGYYSLKEGNISWYPPKKKSMEEFIQEVLNEAVTLIEQMKKGMFPAEPSGNECRTCKHGALCGK